MTPTADVERLVMQTHISQLSHNAVHMQVMQSLLMPITVYDNTDFM